MTPQNYLKYAEFTVNTTEKCNIYRINRLCVLLRQGVGATAVCVSGVSGVSNYMDALGQGAGVVCCPCKCGCLWNCVDALDTGWSQVLSLQVLFRAFWTSCLWKATLLCLHLSFCPHTSMRKKSYLLAQAACRGVVFCCLLRRLFVAFATAALPLPDGFWEWQYSCARLLVCTQHHACYQGICSKQICLTCCVAWDCKGGVLLVAVALIRCLSLHLHLFYSLGMATTKPSLNNLTLFCTFWFDLTMRGRSRAMWEDHYELQQIIHESNNKSHESGNKSLPQILQEIRITDHRAWINRNRSQPKIVLYFTGARDKKNSN